jgi:hypothetical protein
MMMMMMMMMMMIIIIARTAQPVYAVDDLWFESRHGQEMYLFSNTSRLALGRTQSPVQSTGVVFPGDDVAEA